LRLYRNLKNPTMNTTIPQQIKMLFTRLGVISTSVFDAGENIQANVPDQSLVFHSALSNLVNMHPLKYRWTLNAAIQAAKIR
jgi:hypothetical protein